MHSTALQQRQRCACLGRWAWRASLHVAFMRIVHAFGSAAATHMCAPNGAGAADTRRRAGLGLDTAAPAPASPSPLPPEQKCAQVLLTLDNLANRSQYICAKNTFEELLRCGGGEVGVGWNVSQQLPAHRRPPVPKVACEARLLGRRGRRSASSWRRVVALNVRAALAFACRLGAVPIVNENDTVAVQELRIGDNDTLSAQARQGRGCTVVAVVGRVGQGGFGRSWRAGRGAARARAGCHPVCASLERCSRGVHALHSPTSLASLAPPPPLQVATLPIPHRLFRFPHIPHVAAGGDAGAGRLALPHDRRAQPVHSQPQYRPHRPAHLRGPRPRQAACERGLARLLLPTGIRVASPCCSSCMGVGGSLRWCCCRQAWVDVGVLPAGWGMQPGSSNP